MSAAITLPSRRRVCASSLGFSANELGTVGPRQRWMRSDLLVCAKQNSILIGVENPKASRRYHGVKVKRVTGDWGSPLLGALAFLIGLGLIIFTFQQAWLLFQTPPAQILDIQPGTELNVNATVGRLTSILFRLLMLAMMGWAGSLVAKWGLRMYGIRFSFKPEKEAKPTSSQEN